MLCKFQVYLVIEDLNVIMRIPTILKFVFKFTV